MSLFHGDYLQEKEMMENNTGIVAQGLRLL